MALNGFNGDPQTASERFVGLPQKECGRGEEGRRIGFEWVLALQRDDEAWQDASMPRAMNAKSADARRQFSNGGDASSGAPRVLGDGAPPHHFQCARGGGDRGGHRSARICNCSSGAMASFLEEVAAQARMGPFMQPRARQREPARPPLNDQ